MKSSVYELISGNLALRSLGFGPTSVKRSVATVSPEERPFIVLRWGPTEAAFGTAGSTILTVWVYDEPGSYNRIENALNIIRDSLTSVAGYPADDGTVLNRADWNGFSEDLYDDMWNCITKNAVFTVG